MQLVTPLVLYQVNNMGLAGVSRKKADEVLVTLLAGKVVGLSAAVVIYAAKSATKDTSSAFAALVYFKAIVHGA